MTLGDIIRQYRYAKGISQREFAGKCGVTNGYISMLENNTNPKTNKPIVPTIDRLKLIADGMSLSLQELIDMADDTPESVSEIRKTGIVMENEKPLLKDVLTKRRIELNLSIDDVAERSRIPKGTVAKILCGITPNPQFDSVKAIVHAMDMSLDDLEEAQIQPDFEMRVGEIRLIKLYRSVNEDGKNAIIDYAENVTYNPRYKQESSKETGIS